MATPVLQKGFAHLILIITIAFLIVSVLAFAGRRQIYMAYQDAAFSVGINLNNIATNSYVSFIKSQTGQKQDTKNGIFLSAAINYDEKNSLQANVLGDSTNSNKKIIVDLSEQRLYMKEGDNIVGTFLVSTGKWAPTPTGTWAIWTKLRYTRMTGGSKALGTFYDLPNVPYTMYFNQGYGIHGAYWHNNFGHPMSHGCVNMRPEESGIVYNWADVGTPVTVQD